MNAAKQAIRDEAHALGFDAVGFAPAAAEPRDRGMKLYQ